MHKLPPTRRFWLLWLVANALGWAVGLAAALLVPLLMAENANSIPLWGWLCVLPLTWIIAGLLVGVARWLVLGRETAGTTPWLLVSALGGFTGMLAALAVAILIGGTAGLLLAPTLLVTSIGLLQWLLLQRQATPPPSWGLVSLVGGVIGWTECFIVFLLVADALAKLD